MADDSPETRKLGLALAASKASFWERADALEHLARLLVDPDAAVRSEALDLVKHHGLVAKHPPLARRVKALVEDPAPRGPRRGRDPRPRGSTRPRGGRRLADQAAAAQPGDIPAHGEPALLPGRRRHLRLRRCHANHTILQDRRGRPGRGFTDEQIRINYNSALRVVNLGQPESSLILRKPRSPQGQGGVDPSSPTRLTHVGGPRWDGTDGPAYQAILAWIREASRRPGEKRGRESLIFVPFSVSTTPDPFSVPHRGRIEPPDARIT